ncbi:cellulase family glycosylhydrolase [Mucilaginibacter sp. P25]|uniref:cellulase family glycosylhydrolase n=1 Tax=Mucilaginibacter sp. P25 TaxID=3423945 RepID=UPI003D7AA8E7
MKKMYLLSLKGNCGIKYLGFLLVVILNLSCAKKDSSSAPKTTTTLPPTMPVAIPSINTSASTAKEIIVDMGAGFNLGNTFETNTSNSPTFASVKPIIDLYYNAGMRHIRIPVTWVEGFPSNIADANGNINIAHPRLFELKAIVEYALSKKMYVEINAHHEHWLKNNYDGSAAFDNKFKTLWTGIATFFKDETKAIVV